tara:strand:+ start:5509 stop:7251 length:1743 start_codon:yes stop_codon:yes gene_type:complete
MISEKLRENGIELRTTTPGNYKTYCPNCRYTRKSRNKLDKPLSVTIDNDGGAVWLCHNCEHAGNIPSSQRTQEIKVTYKKPRVPDALKVTSQMDSFFADRKISKDTTEAFRIFTAMKNYGNGPEETVAFPYHLDGEVVNVKYRSHSKQFQQEANAQRTLFNIDAVEGDSIIFVEGEMDVLACWEAGIKNAVSLPDGAPKEAKYREDDKRFAALAECDKLEKMKSVYIAVDMDEAGQALAAELAHRFGKDKCLKVQWPSLNDVQCKDANECLVDHGAVVLRECLDNATHYPIDGVYRANDYITDVWDLYAGKQVKPFSTGFEQLDTIYRLLPATFHVVTGIPNHGKSNFIDQLLINTAKLHNWKFALFSPEHSSTYHIRRLAEIYTEKPFDMGPSERMTPEDLQGAVSFIDEHFKFIESKDRVPTIDWLLEKARAACIRHGINGVVIDPYNEISANRSAGKREDEHIRDLISACKAFCRNQGIIMWVVAHPAKMMRKDDGSYPVPGMYDISGAAHWNNMADVGLVVHRLFDEGKTVVCTKKVREQGYYGNLGEAVFEYDTNRKCYREYNPAAVRTPMPYSD